MSDSAGTSWLDVERRAWSPKLLAATDLSEQQMPALVEGTQPGGVLRGELAARWGMTGNVVVAGGAGDNAASACGMGTVRPGAAFVSLGTSGVLFATNGTYLPNPASAVHTFCHALPRAWHQMGVILYWVHDASPGCTRTYHLIDVTARMAAQLIAATRIPMLRSTVSDITALIDVLRN